MTRAEMVAACKAVNKHLDDMHTMTDDVVRDCYEAWCRTDAKDPEPTATQKAAVALLQKALTAAEYKVWLGLLNSLKPRQEAVLEKVLGLLLDDAD